MNDTLAHYGVKGMRKGIRKKRPTRKNIRGMSLSDLFDSSQYKKSAERGARFLSDMFEGMRKDLKKKRLSDLFNSSQYKKSVSRGARFLSDMFDRGGIGLMKISGDNAPKPIVNVSRRMFDISSRLRRYSDMK